MPGGKKAEDAGLPDIVITPRMAGINLILVRCYGNKGPGNAHRLMLQHRLSKSEIERLDPAVKPASVVVAS